MNERSRELIGYIDVNPKIRGLAEQSGCSIDKLGYGEGNLEKFAELIVRECAMFLDQKTEVDDDGVVVNVPLASEMLEHFGVEC